MQEKTIVLSTFVVFGLLLMGSITYFVTPTLKPELPTPNLEKWTSLSKNPESLQNGEYQFKVRCSSCHGMNGEGSNHGATLTDKLWIHGTGSLDDIFNTVYFGLPNTEMKGSGNKLRTDDIQDIVIYVHSLSTKKND